MIVRSRTVYVENQNSDSNILSEKAIPLERKDDQYLYSKEELSLLLSRAFVAGCHKEYHKLYSFTIERYLQIVFKNIYEQFPITDYKKMLEKTS